MVGAQKSMILWCARKIQSVKLELAEAQTNLDAAKANKWSPAAWAKQVKLHTDKIEFYKKINMALEAGYHIVPPFPVDTFAIRVKNTAAPRGDPVILSLRTLSDRRSALTAEGRRDTSPNGSAFLGKDDWHPLSG
jgi:hypothetical protein